DYENRARYLTKVLGESPDPWDRTHEPLMRLVMCFWQDVIADPGQCEIRLSKLQADMAELATAHQGNPAYRAEYGEGLLDEISEALGRRERLLETELSMTRLPSGKTTWEAQKASPVSGSPARPDILFREQGIKNAAKLPILKPRL